jgi:hypothetical protein
MTSLQAGYTTSTGVASDLLAQFLLAEETIAALGVVVWPMVAFEADDALAAAATCFRSEAEVNQVVSVNTRSPFSEAAMGTIPSLACDVSLASHGMFKSPLACLISK